MEKVVVFGAAGHVGRAVVRRMCASGDYQVIACCRNPDQIWESRNDYLKAVAFCADVSNPLHLINVAEWAVQPELGGSFVDVVIYCVGHCPPGGVLKEISTPLSGYRVGDFDREISMHVRGPFNVFQKFLPRMRDGGRFVFMSTAATRILGMPLEARPPIHMYHHLAVMAAEDALIEGMRADPEVRRRDIKIDRIAPPRISDSPFHQCSEAAPAGPSVTTEEVVNAVIGCLLSSKSQDKVMLPAKK